MRDLLFLAHRIPFPPDKGDKIRAWHMLERLSRSHRIHLGCFIDDPADRMHIPALRAMCADAAFFDIVPRNQRMLASLRMRPGRPLTTGYFHDARLRRWVAGKLAAGIGRAFVFCSAMAPYLMGTGPVHRVLDMVDVDSEKWRAYATGAGWPVRAIWKREARTLLAFERQAARCFHRTLLVSEPEADCLRTLAPESAERIGAMENGVDLEHFSPAHVFPDPHPPVGQHIVFTGTMDYRPNVAAVTWFAAEVMPRLHARGIPAHFTVVGANPAADVLRLASDTVRVTGRVIDVRPYVAHAALVVAPLTIARGIQNKVLEAMAMARPVVASPEAAEGVRAQPGRDLLVASGADAMADVVGAVLAGRHPTVGNAARRAMVDGYAWSNTLAALDGLFTGTGPT
jgi:sugar transferase (PEP-CTERM/EpsH1 system associated)